jgi:hypothetical protein
MAIVAACFVAGAAACGDDGNDSEARGSTTTRDQRPPLVATSVAPPSSASAPASTIPLPTSAPAEVPEECDAFPDWLGPSTTAVVRRTEGSASCDEVSAVAREFFFMTGAPATATVQGWECSRDAVGTDHVGDCVGPNGRLTADVSRPGDG